jgi:hypothetical protein
VHEPVQVKKQVAPFSHLTALPAPTVTVAMVPAPSASTEALSPAMTLQVLPP